MVAARAQQVGITTETRFINGIGHGAREWMLAHMEVPTAFLFTHLALGQTAPPPSPNPPLPSFTRVKQVDPTGQARVGDALTVLRTDTKSSAAPSRNIKISDPLHSGTLYLDDSASDNGVYLPQTRTLTWTVPAVSPGQSGTLSFKVTIRGE
jgi:uncharacterized repeat protein (TIGR01451 family)